jgi:hypothetical protein
MKLIYMECTLGMIAGQYPEAVEALVQSGTVKAANEIPYLVIEVPEEEPKKTKRNTNKNKQ